MAGVQIVRAAVQGIRGVYIKCAKDGSISVSRHGIGSSYVRVGSVRASQLSSNLV